MQRLILATSFLPNKQEPKASRKTYKPNAAYARVRQEAAAWIRRDFVPDIAEKEPCGPGLVKQRRAQGGCLGTKSR